MCVCSVSVDFTGFFFPTSIAPSTTNTILMTDLTVFQEARGRQHGLEAALEAGSALHPPRARQPTQTELKADVHMGGRARYQLQKR